LVREREDIRITTPIATTAAKAIIASSRLSTRAP
jgi:hypothetical protein